MKGMGNGAEKFPQEVHFQGAGCFLSIIAIELGGTIRFECQIWGEQSIMKSTSGINTKGRENGEIFVVRGEAF